MMGNTLILPSGQPSMMGVGEPATGEEGFPLPYTVLKPFNQAMDQLFPGQSENQQGMVNDLGPDAITIEEVQQAVGAVKNLKGQVFVGGDLAKSGATENRVTLYITNKLDKQTILNSVRETKLFGRIDFIPIPEGEVPPGAVPLTGGANVVPAAA